MGAFDLVVVTLGFSACVSKWRARSRVCRRANRVT